MLPIPPELVLQVLSSLPIQSILSLRSSSRAWNKFISANEAFIYHATAILHGFAEPHKSLEQSKGIHVFPCIEDVTSWKEFCTRHFMMEMSRIGRRPVRHAAMSCLKDMVQRFKIDKEQGTVISTHMSGGLSVASIADDTILWALPEAAVRRFAHCEYDHGFLIFDRPGSLLDVWRRKRDSQSDPLRASLGPHALQEWANGQAIQWPQSVSQDDRGAFVPFTLIFTPSSICAYRFVYPSLLAISHDYPEAYLYDIPTGQLQQRVSLFNSLHLRLHVENMDFSARHIVVCADGRGLLIFSRQPDMGPPLIRFCPEVSDFREFLGDRIYYLPEHHEGDTSADFRSLRECPLERMQDVSLIEPSLEMGSAVHISPCGSHLVCASFDGFLYIIRDFSITLSDVISQRDSITIIAMHNPITHMAFEDNRIAFYAANSGLFFIPFASPDHVAADRLGSSPVDPWPRLYQVNAPFMHTDLALSWESNMHCNCVQITSTGLWYVPAIERGDDEPPMRQLRYVDFTASLAGIKTREVEQAVELAE